MKQTIEQQFIHAINLNDFETVEKIIEEGFDINTSQGHALRIAAANGYSQIVQLLLDHDASVIERDCIALKEAAKRGHLVVVKILIQHGAKVSRGKNSVFDWAEKNEQPRILQYLEKYVLANPQ